MTEPRVAFDPERVLPNVVFRSPELTQLELDRIWHNDWVFVGTADSVPEAGDQRPITVGEQPAILLRRQDGTLAALSNLCAHRGTLLIDEPGNAKRIQCPYHAWTFAEDGRLLSVPFADPAEIDRAEHRLPSYQVAEWHDLVFVALSLDVEPFASRVEAIDALLTSRNIDALYHWPEHEETDEWACNWKLAALNAMESYHLFRVHPETLEPYSPTKESYYLTGSARSTATGGTSRGEDDYVLIAIPPGFVGVLTPGSFVWQSARPIAVDRCEVRTGGAFSSKPPERQSGALARWITSATNAMAVAAFPDFLPEDKAICERGQRGAAGDFDPAPILEIERVVADFGHYLNWRLNDIEPPPEWSL